MEKISSVLLVLPVSLIGNWLSEFEKWAPGINVYDHHSGTNKEKEVVLRKVMHRGGVILTTYGMVTTRGEDLCNKGGRRFIWDYVILDEGHRIKNPTKTQKAVFALLAKHRLVLTGTAVQNNLSELWSLFHFTHQGTLFGNLAGFRQDFEGPINRGREKDAKAGEREMGVQLALQLKQMIQPYFLRRTKAEIFRTGQGPKVQVNKEDLVLWTYLSECQQQLYRDFLESDSVKSILMSSKSPLLQLNILKKICDHPRLLPKKACVQLGLCDTMTEDEIREFLEDDNHCPFSIDDVSDEDLLVESGKMKLTLELVLRLRSEGHRTLIFSTSRRILDMIQRILRRHKFTIARLDGSIAKPAERNQIVKDFQQRGKDVFLLTTQVGGVGLTLTNANRVIIYDPNWNPATDAQAVDRAFRIGQTKDVIVYRLITCGTIEEKIYSRQIFKDSIIKQTTGKQSDPTRYFTRGQLRELFVLNDPLQSLTQIQLEKMHKKELTESCKIHIDFLLGTDLVFGVSHHDLLFSVEEEKENVSEDQLKFISQRVVNAREIRQREAEVVAEDLQRNPHVVPLLNSKSAFARNRAAAMPSTVNPVDLYDRPKLPGSRTGEVLPSSRITHDTFIDLVDDDPADSDSTKYFHSTMVEDPGRKPFVEGEVITLDDDDDEEISIVKEVKRESSKVTSLHEPEKVDSDSEIEDITPRQLENDSRCVGSRAASSRESKRVDEKDQSAETTIQKHNESVRQRNMNKTHSQREESFNSTHSTSLVIDPKTSFDESRSTRSRHDDEVSEDNSPVVVKGRARRFVVVSDDDGDGDNDWKNDSRSSPKVKRTSMEDEDSNDSDNKEKSRKNSLPDSFMEDSDDDKASHHASQKIIVDSEVTSKHTTKDSMTSSSGQDIVSKKVKRKSVAYSRRSSSDSSELIIQSKGAEDSMQPQQIDDDLRAAQEAAYDRAFEDDDVDESLIEKSILDSSAEHDSKQSICGDRDGAEKGPSTSNVDIVENSFMVDEDEDQNDFGTGREAFKNATTNNDDSVVEDSDEDL